MGGSDGVLGFKSSDTVAQITLDKDSFTYKEVEVKDDDGNIKKQRRSTMPT